MTGAPARQGQEPLPLLSVSHSEMRPPREGGLGVIGPKAALARGHPGSLCPAPRSGALCVVIAPGVLLPLAAPSQAV